MMPTTVQPVINVAHPVFHILKVIRETYLRAFVETSKAEGIQPSKSGNKNIYFM